MSNFDDYRDPSRQPKGRRWVRAFYPIIGLFVMLLAAGLAFVSMEPAYNFLAAQGLFDRTTIDPQTLQLAVAVGIFLIIVLLLAFVFALVQPRDKTKKLVTEKALIKEREAKQAELKAKKRRQQAMRKKMKQRNRN